MDVHVGMDRIHVETSRDLSCKEEEGGSVPCLWKWWKTIKAIIGLLMPINAQLKRSAPVTRPVLAVATHLT